MTRITSVWLFTGILVAAHSNAQSVTHRWSFNSTGSGGGEMNTTSGAPGGSSSSDNFVLAAQRGNIINDHRRSTNPLHPHHRHAHQRFVHLSHR